MKKKIIGIFVFMLLIATFILPASGKVNLNKTEIGLQHLIGGQEAAVDTGDDVEIYIYAGFSPYNPNPSIGFGVTIEVINNLSEAIWVYCQDDYYSLFSGKPLDSFRSTRSFVAPPNESYWYWHSKGVGIPCRYTVTVQADLVKYVSRSGFQIRRLVFFPGEK